MSKKLRKSVHLEPILFGVASFMLFLIFSTVLPRFWFELRHSVQFTGLLIYLFTIDLIFLAIIFGPATYLAKKNGRTDFFSVLWTEFFCLIVLFSLVSVLFIIHH